MKLINIPSLLLILALLTSGAYTYVYIKHGQATAEGVAAGVVTLITSLGLALSKFRSDDNDDPPNNAPTVVVAPAATPPVAPQQEVVAPTVEQ